MSYKFNKVKILVIDEIPPMLKIVKSVLTVFGIGTVFTAENGEDAYEIVCKEDPDLIITDWISGSMTAMDFVEKIRRDEGIPNPYIPIIMMTGYTLGHALKKREI